MTTIAQRPSLQDMVKSAYAGTAARANITSEALRQMAAHDETEDKTASAEDQQVEHFSTEHVLKLASALEFIADTIKTADPALSPGHGPGALEVSQSRGGGAPLEPGQSGQAISRDLVPSTPSQQVEKVQGGKANTGLETNDDSMLSGTTHLASANFDRIIKMAKSDDSGGGRGISALKGSGLGALGGVAGGGAVGGGLALLAHRKGKNILRAAGGLKGFTEGHLHAEDMGKLEEVVKHLPIHGRHAALIGGGIGAAAGLPGGIAGGAAAGAGLHKKSSIGSKARAALNKFPGVKDIQVGRAMRDVGMGPDIAARAPHLDAAMREAGKKKFRVGVAKATGTGALVAGGGVYAAKRQMDKKSSINISLIRKLAEDAINPAHISAGSAVPPDYSEAGQGVPSEPSDVTSQKRMIGSNQSAINYTKGQAKAQPKREVSSLLNQPALSSAHDNVLQKAFDHTGQAGVKISMAEGSLRVKAARALLSNLMNKVAEEEESKKDEAEESAAHEKGESKREEAKEKRKGLKTKESEIPTPNFSAGTGGGQ